MQREQLWVRRPRLAIAMAALPALLLMLLYAPSLGSPYRLDDFAWLSLPNPLNHGRNLLWALFSPQAQGTIRPLGDRVWFLLASSWFGLNPVPLHLLALVTQIANVLLVIAVGRRLLGSLTAGTIAAALWIVHSSLGEPMVWASAFNEVLYTFWFLLALNALFRWIDSGRSAWLILHLLAIILGFGTLELMITFPPIVAAYLALFAPERWKAVLPSTAIASIYVVAHLFAVRLPQSGPYQMTYDWSIANTLAHYWTKVLGPEDYATILPTNSRVAVLGTVLMTAGLILRLIFDVRRKCSVSLFCLLWFVVGLAPILPLRQHFMPYYTFLPLIGLALLAAHALVGARSWPARWLAAAGIVIYLFCEIPSTLFFVRTWNADRSRDLLKREAQLANAVEQIRRSQPEGPVFLDRLDTEQFWWGLCYGELIRRGFTDLHVLPDAGEHGVAIPPREWCRDSNFQLSAEETKRVLREGRGHVYDIASVPPRVVSLQSP